jgi:hypothetical protein
MGQREYMTFVSLILEVIFYFGRQLHLMQEARLLLICVKYPFLQSRDERVGYAVCVLDRQPTKGSTRSR